MSKISVFLMVGLLMSGVGMGASFGGAQALDGCSNCQTAWCSKPKCRQNGISCNDCLVSQQIFEIMYKGNGGGKALVLASFFVRTFKTVSNDRVHCVAPYGFNKDLVRAREGINAAYNTIGSIKREESAKRDGLIREWLAELQKHKRTMNFVASGAVEDYGCVSCQSAWCPGVTTGKCPKDGAIA